MLSLYGNVKPEDSDHRGDHKGFSFKTTVQKSNNLFKGNWTNTLYTNLLNRTLSL